MFYPFILMDQREGNGLPDPYGGAEQARLPWRGRISLSTAPGRAGSPDGTSAADAEVAAFFGTAQASDFTVGDGTVTYLGPEEWGVRRFILHYAALCAAAGGVESFCIGSEMRGLTQIRGASGFVAVQAFRDLAAEVRALLGPGVKLGYAADWSEYFGYQPQDGSGDRLFHLDPLWADPEIDFIGIDNYMPLSDWRDGNTHADRAAGWRSIHDLDYLRANIAGGEGYDWYYASEEAIASQRRTPITDEAHGEPWIWRYKDIRNWWSQPHHDRIGGVRQALPTEWIPASKPIRFTELGCAAVDKGTNQPNKFVDPKSSESALPRGSNGLRDDFIQIQYLRAMLGYWAEPQNNPVSELYGGAMIDLDHAYVWAWDTRPFPAFPNNRTLWGDGGNMARGHWINGRAGSRTLASVVTEMCARAGLTQIDTQGLYGVVRGFVVDDIGEARAALQSLMLAYGFDAVERDGVLAFRMRKGNTPVTLLPDELARTAELETSREQIRAPEAETTGRVRVRFIESGADHDVVSEEAVLPDEATHAVSSNDLSLAMTRSEGRQLAERWLAESRLARDSISLALPPSRMEVGAGDVIALGGATYRVDRVEQSEVQTLDAVRIEAAVYEPSEMPEDDPAQSAFVAPVPVLPLFMDLPLMSGDEVPHAPHLAVTAQPWPGSVAVYASGSDDSYALSDIIASRAMVGMTETPLIRARPGVWDNGAALQVNMITGALEGRDAQAVLNGANLAAVGDGSSGNWELIQFKQADLIAPDTYWLSGRLRGQAGSDGLMPDAWPAGSWFVLLNGAPQQITLTSSQRRIARHYRIGAARRAYDDPSYRHLIEAFDGNGLRPFAPGHLRAVSSGGGDLALTWIRRGRIDADSWEMPEIPLGEETESYLLRVIAADGGTVLREVQLTQPTWAYSAAQQAADGMMAGDRIAVAQVSARYGPGPFASVEV